MQPILSMVYVFVLIGSFVGLCVVFSFHAMLRQRFVRRFVRGMRTQFQSLQECGANFLEETQAQRPLRLSRMPSAAFQKVCLLLRTAQRLQASGEDQEAERTLIQALTIEPQAPAVQAQLAALYLRTGRENKAEAMYKELIRCSDDVAHYAALGLAESRQGKYRESCLSYEEAVKRDPKNPERSAALGKAYVAAQCFTEAIPHLEKAATNLTRDMEPLHLLAECHLRAGETKKAEETLHRLHHMEPYNTQVKEKLLSLAQA